MGLGPVIRTKVKRPHVEGLERDRLQRLLGDVWRYRAVLVAAPAGSGKTTLLAASRSAPRFNLSRLRVSGELLKIGGDALRFRSWEVERLFRDFYREPLPPEDLAELARRTEGWAAGLQLFHLATRGKSPAERRRTLAGLSVRSKLVREYLAQNVFEDLPQELRRFLLDTCVLGFVTGPLCDRLRGTCGSERQLAELERRQFFIYA